MYFCECCMNLYREMKIKLLGKNLEELKEAFGVAVGISRTKNAIVEVDLHAAELLDTTAGMQPRDILQHQLDVFRRTMDEHSRDLGRKIVFIHGKGDGVLRSALLKELRTAYKHCQHQDASFREYGFGATMVTIGRKNR